jgi:hypothetical protein
MRIDPTALPEHRRSLTPEEADQVWSILAEVVPSREALIRAAVGGAS